MKTYVITLSSFFPQGHFVEGEMTGFREKVLKAINEPFTCPIVQKLHTIRANYDFWKRRFDKIEAGEACLSIRQWVGKPYGKGSSQLEIARLTRNDGIGIQKLTFDFEEINLPKVHGASLNPTVRILANNDGLSLDDWKDWFRDYDLSKPMAIIHFTKYRY